jgi:hypothetical protein
MPLYYTKADLQHRRWLISECIAAKGASICCDTQKGDKVEEKEMRKFKLANAFLDVICEYENLSTLFYAGDPVENINCITEKQLDEVFAWFQKEYMNILFRPKESVVADANGDLQIPPGIPPLPFSGPCCLALESGGLILLEDPIEEICIELETTTCLLASDSAAWSAYMNAMNSYNFYEY